MSTISVESWRFGVVESGRGVGRPRSIRTKWDEILQQLRNWERDPSQLEDDGVEPPSAALLDAVRRYVVPWLMRIGVPEPLRVATNGEGGIVLEWKKGQDFISIEVAANGRIEQSVYRSCRLVKRRELITSWGH